MFKYTAKLTGIGLLATIIIFLLGEYTFRSTIIHAVLKHFTWGLVLGCVAIAAHVFAKRQQLTLPAAVAGYVAAVLIIVVLVLGFVVLGFITSDTHGGW